MTELGVLAERYALEELVATGGMGSVYRARDEVLARAVAVKTLHPHLAEDDTFLERFRREALAAARLTHPNIVSIYDTGTEETEGDPRHYIVMEYCGGGTLEDLATAGPVEPARVSAIGGAICDALAYAHQNGVLHRDIKPGNVLLADDGTVKVSDFGIAKAAFTGKDITTSGSLLGTVTYISPEQARGEEPDARSDIYSLGVVLYELAVGRPPFAGDTPVGTAIQHVNDPPPPPRSIRAGIPRELETVILETLSKDPAARPATAEELKARLTKRVSGSATAVMRATPAPTQVRQQPHGGDASWVAKVILLIGVVVLIAIGASWLFASDDARNDARDPRDDRRTVLPVMEADAFDPPPGDGFEHSDSVGAAWDGDPASSWTTETYDDGFEGVGKDGVGLVFDLGEPTEVDAIELVTKTPGMAIEIRVSDTPPAASATSLDLVAESASVAATEEFDVGRSGRYWLVWITELPADSGKADISEVRFLGS